MNLYNIAARDDDPLVDACARAGIAYVLFFPVGGFQPLMAEQLTAVAARHNLTARRRLSRAGLTDSRGW